MWTAKEELSENAEITTSYAVAGNIAGAIVACGQDRKRPEKPCRYPQIMVLFGHDCAKVREQVVSKSGEGHYNCRSFFKFSPCVLEK